MDDNTIDITIDRSTNLILVPGDGTTWPLTDQAATEMQTRADELTDYLGPHQTKIFAARLRSWADYLDPG